MFLDKEMRGLGWDVIDVFQRRPEVPKSPLDPSWREESVSATPMLIKNSASLLEEKFTRGGVSYLDSDVRSRTQVRDSEYVD